MSLRLIELQVAIPRTQDAGKVQEKLQQQSQVNQFQAASDEKKDSEINRITVEKQERTEKQQLNDRESSNPQHHQQQKKRDNQEVEEMKHPYKGHKVDFSG